MPESNHQPPRFGLRQVALVLAVAAWATVVVMTDRPLPPAPPLVPYGVALR